MSEGESFIYEVGKSIVTDRNVIKAGQDLVKTTVQGGAQILGAAGATILGTGGVTGISATAGAVGTSITTAAAGVGNAVMGTTVVSGVTTVVSAVGSGLATIGGAIASAPILPFLAGAAAVGGFIGWLCSDD